MHIFNIGHIYNLNNIPNSHYFKTEIEKTLPISCEKYPKYTKNNYIGCLIGGAIGDALGWPVEFRRLPDIKKIYGKNGICDLKIVNNGKAEITDDTQMTIFTADGLLKSAIGNFDENKIPNMKIVYQSYQDWLKTQYVKASTFDKGWISKIGTLYERRAPGTTCINSLQNGIDGSIEKPLNNSAGCGGVMRVAPVGLMYYKNPKLAFEVGARCAALTHGHPNAYLPAGVHSCIIANIINGKNIKQSIDNSLEVLIPYKGSEHLEKLIKEAKKLANSDIDSEQAISLLGEGWHGDEAIAIAVYCSLKEPDNFEKALIMAVNHNGDSDSTGAIVGNIMGTYLGNDVIPSKWKNSVELSSELTQLATDLYTKPSRIENAKQRYITP